jgi:uncharacterized protein YegL
MEILGSTDGGRRMLVYLLLDVSGSMDGTPIQAVREGVAFLNRELRGTPEAVEMVHLCVIVFNNSAHIVTPLSPLTKFTPPSLSASGGTNMAAALDLVEREINNTYRPNTGEVRGDYKPAIFLLTDGEPNDVEAAVRSAERLKNRPSGHTLGTFLALGCGPHVNAAVLHRIAKNVALMENMSSENIQAFFKWVTASLSTSSRRASRGAGQDVQSPPEPIPTDNQGKPAFVFDF